MSTPDNRTDAEHDCDRILYSDAFRRLGEVTQVVAVGEMPLFHTRLTHTLKVQQLSRRLAEQLNRDPASHAILDARPINESSAEAAGLAHDLGHPPFGHIGEQVLDACCVDAGLDGFEGNAQTFRIVTKLARRASDPAVYGLELSDDTLRGVIKYPWMRSGPHKAAAKWNAYRSEKDEFIRLQDGQTVGDPSIEAQIMDWADDITYAVHDLEDFVRAGLVPLGAVANDEVERATFLQSALDRVLQKIVSPEESVTRADLAAALTSRFTDTLEAFFGELGAPRGREDALSRLRQSTSRLIGDYVASTAVNVSSDGNALELEVEQLVRGEVELLKQLTWHYVIHRPGLATMQAGQQRILERLFVRLTEWLELVDAGTEPARRLPARLWDLHELARSEPGCDTYQTEKSRRARSVADYLASLTEGQAVNLATRLEGGSGNSVLDPWLAY